MSINQGLITLFTPGRELIYKKGEIIVRGNAKLDGAFLITKGYVRVYDINDRGSIKQHVIYGPGACFPMMWVFNDEKTHAFFEAMTPVRTLKSTKQNILQQIHAHPAENFVLEQHMLKQFRQYVRGLESLTHKDSSHRVIRRILALIDTFGRPTTQGIELPFTITHQQLSQMSDVSRETASRIISTLSKQQHILVVNKRIIVPDITTLKALL